MIRFSSALAPPDRSLLDSRGGFVWWYLDLVDENGDGLVVIWSFGLPFLPGYAQSARLGVAPLAHTLPSLNLVVYQGGREQLYLLQRLNPADARWGEGEELRLGASTFRSFVEGNQRIVEANIDCDLPGGARLSGQVSARGAAVHAEHTDPPETSPHCWTPLLAPGHGEATLYIDGVPSFCLQGRAYHDRNSSPLPLQELGIDRWFWARGSCDDGERVVYVLWPKDGGAPRAFSLHIRPDGQVLRREGLKVSERGTHRLRYGMSSCEELIVHGEDDVRVRLHSLLENGPFYLRFVGTLQQGDAQGPAVAEMVNASRVDMDVHRPFVRMRVHDLAGPNSPMLPWFSGPSRGRWARLGRSFLEQLSP